MLLCFFYYYYYYTTVVAAATTTTTTATTTITLIRVGEEVGRWGSRDEERKVDKIDTICRMHITVTSERKT